MSIRQKYLDHSFYVLYEKLRSGHFWYQPSNWRKKILLLYYNRFIENALKLYQITRRLFINFWKMLRELLADSPKLLNMRMKILVVPLRFERTTNEKASFYLATQCSVSLDIPYAG